MWFNREVNLAKGDKFRERDMKHVSRDETAMRKGGIGTRIFALCVSATALIALTGTSVLSATPQTSDEQAQAQTQAQSQSHTLAESARESQAAQDAQSSPSTNESGTSASETETKTGANTGTKPTPKLSPWILTPAALRPPITLRLLALQKLLPSSGIMARMLSKMHRMH